MLLVPGCNAGYQAEIRCLSPIKCDWGASCLANGGGLTQSFSVLKAFL